MAGTKWRRCNDSLGIPNNGTFAGRGRKCCQEYGLYSFYVDTWSSLGLDRGEWQFLRIEDITGLTECWAGITRIRPIPSIPTYSGMNAIVFLEQEEDGLYLKTIPAPTSKIHMRLKFYDIQNQSSVGGYNNYMRFVIEELGHADYNGGAIAYYEHIGGGLVVQTAGPLQGICGGQSACDQSGFLWQPAVARPVGRLSTSTATLTGYSGPALHGPILSWKGGPETESSGAGLRVTVDGWTCGGAWYSSLVEFPTIIFNLPGSGGFFNGDVYHPRNGVASLGRHSHPVFYDYTVLMETQISGFRTRNEWPQAIFNAPWNIGSLGSLLESEWDSVVLNV